jgi:hypothetical protein
MTRIIFINWLRRGGISKFMDETKIHVFENSWLGLTRHVRYPFQWMKKRVNFDFYESLKNIITITPLIIFYLM